MRKTFQYRIYPNPSQEHALEATLEGCRWLYNSMLEQRKNAWESNKTNLSRYDQNKVLPQLKEEQPILKDIYAQILQNVSARVDLAFKAFFRRVKSGDTPGYPRFRNKFRYDSFCYPQTGFSLQDNFIKMSKVGCVKVRKHRPIDGVIKTCVVKRTPTGKWFVGLVCEIEHKFTKQPIFPAIGVDMGLKHFASLSNGEQIENPRFFRKEEKNLAKVQRRFSKQEKGTNARCKSRKVVARVHERISNKRHNFAHQESRKLINIFNTVCVEDLSINDMKQNSFCGVNKSIEDAAWRQFLSLLDYKAEEAGKQVVKINPAYTSQTCSVCGTRHKLKLSERVYRCIFCGLSLNRDVNAAINILKIGLGTQSLVST
jgi:putative transposase